MSKILDFLLGQTQGVDAEDADGHLDVEAGDTVPAFDAKLTPDAIRRATFSPAALGRRGYDPSDVEAFRLRVTRTVEADARDLEDALRRARIYEAETRRLRDVYRANNSDLEIPQPTAAAEALQDAIEIVTRAEQTGDQIVRSATLQAQMLVTTARTRYTQIIRDAEEQATRALADVQARGDNPAEEQRLHDTIIGLRAIAQSTKGQLEGALHSLLAELEQIEILPLPDGEPVRAR